MTKISTKCENCVFYVEGDPAKAFGNVGICTFMNRGIGVNACYPKLVPFWAGNIVHRVTSWEGQDCPTYKQGPNAQPDAPGGAL